MATDDSATPLPSTVTAHRAAGGLEVLTVANEHGSAEVYLQGAHVTRWTPVGRSPVLWLSSTSAFEPGVPIRGGIPICFPWFGAKSDDPGAPAHGYARRQAWTLVDASDGERGTVLRLRLAPVQDAAPGASACLDALYEITVGPSLSVRLTVTNTGDDVATFEEAQHTYLQVRDVRTTEVRGLEDVTYLDKAAAAGSDAPSGPDGAPLVPHGQVDRVYLGTSTPVTVDDGERTVVVTKTCSADTVVWSPGADLAARMGDVTDSQWHEMLCVESANVLSHEVVLAPGQSHTLGSTYTVGPSA